MNDLVLGIVSTLVVALVGGMFGLPWLSRRNAKKSTDATAAQLYDGLAQKWLDRYDAELTDLRMDFETMRNDLDNERLWTAMLVGAIRLSGTIEVPDRPIQMKRT